MEHFNLGQKIQRLWSDVEVELFKVKKQYDEKWTAEQTAMEVKHQDCMDGYRAKWDKKMGITLDNIEMVEGQNVVKLRDMNVARAGLTRLRNDFEEFAAGVPKIRQRIQN
jgi:hypothetical protein